MKTKHTPAPWVIGQPEKYPTTVQWSGKDGFLYTVADLEGSHLPDVEVEANTHLILSAPELLEAAKQAHCDCTLSERASGHKVGCWMPDLSAAINKAEGREA